MIFTDLANFVGMDNIGVIQLGGSPTFFIKPRQEIFFGCEELGWQNLDGNFSIQAGLFGK